MLFLKFALFLFLFHSVAWSCDTQKHHIFLLHGIGGNKGTFGSLENLLNRQHPCIKARTFEYKTGSLQNTYDFARDFNQYVSSLQTVEIRNSDKVSLIMHSQGGLVGSLWLKFLSENNLPLLKQLDSFITLSTPFWGADIAHIGKQFFYTLPPGMVNPISPFGRNELNEMSYGSSTIQDFVRNLDNVFKSAPQLRPLNIGGMKRFYDSRIGEDDIVVPTHSMSPHRYYLKDYLSFFDKPSRVLPNAFKKNSETPFLIVPADHIKLTQHGIADIPSRCLKDIKCDHPSLQYILDHLKGIEVKPRKEYSLTRFRVTVFINNPFGITYDQKDLTIQVHGLDRYTKVPLIERITPFQGNAKVEKGLVFSFGGNTKLKGASKLFVTLRYKNKNIKTYEVPVEAGLSSFVDTDLATIN